MACGSFRRPCLSSVPLTATTAPVMVIPVVWVVPIIVDGRGAGFGHTEYVDDGCSEYGGTAVFSPPLEQLSSTDQIRHLTPGVLASSCNYREHWSMSREVGPDVE